MEETTDELPSPASGEVEEDSEPKKTTQQVIDEGNALLLELGAVDIFGRDVFPPVRFGGPC